MPPSTAEPALTFCIVHWNQPERCVATGVALLDQGVPLKLLIVDNGSSAEALKKIAAGLPDAEIIESGYNAGFGPGANVGLAHWLAEEQGEWIGLCPHDARPDPGCLSMLIEALARRPRAGLACAEFGIDDRPVMDRFFGGMTLPALRVDGEWQAADYPHGTLMFLRRECLADIGLFDESFFAYCEEADLGIRARQAGWEVGFVWGAIVKNPSQETSPPVIEYLMLRNTLMLVRKHSGRYPTFIRFEMALFGLLRDSLRPWRQKSPGRLAAQWRALGDFLAGRDGPPTGPLEPASVRRGNQFD